MGVLKVIELLAESDKSWEEAAQNAVKQASKSLKNIRSVNITNQSCVVNGERITNYRINAKITFEVE
ncbi:MAG: dodecin family protein [Cyclobacteriaceae bacterium]|nr:dodecin family protein [Cyclobacteriaceae bacterium]